MSVSVYGLFIIETAEGFMGAKYSGLDQYNKTIGFGHVIKLGEDFSKGITINQAETLLKNDLKNVISKLNTFLDANGIKVNQAQFDALLMFSINVGENIWASENDFELRTLLINGDYTNKQIIEAFTEFTKYRETRDGKLLISNGLWKRRMNEALLFISGEYKYYELDELKAMGYIIG
jgi:GH24 family phage-related lysozyme (muramidase)